jgi:hypothetical protein
VTHPWFGYPDLMGLADTRIRMGKQYKSVGDKYWVCISNLPLVFRAGNSFKYGFEIREGKIFSPEQRFFSDSASRRDLLLIYG